MDKQFFYDAIVVGGGAAGLTSAAYLCKDGYHVLLCEKESKTGGLVGSFNHNGFHFDSGIRAFENSGIIFPMLKQLGIEMDFVKSKVSIGIEDHFIRLHSKESLWEYEKFLGQVFPENASDIHAIIIEIQNVMKYMDVLYGIDNPLFLDYSENLGYIFTTIVPWLFRYGINIKKAMKLDESVNDYLLKFTKNQALIDMITQHFFKNTPTFFALSYFGLYLDYSYPIGGTRVLAEKLTSYIEDHHGEIATKTEISEIDIQEKKIKTADGRSFAYKNLIWTADSKTLYRIIKEDESRIINHQDFKEQKQLVEQHHGGDSVLTIFLGVDLNKKYFEERSGPHLFYTPQAKGISSASLGSWDKFKTQVDLKNENAKAEVKDLISTYLELTTFEISCPVLRDENLAPHGKTGLIISTLIDYSLVKSIQDAGWYEEFKEFSTSKTIDILNASVFTELKENIAFSICSTPLTLEERTGNHQGAITGWAFKENGMPSETRFKKIVHSTCTPIPNLYQAGQWTFSPSGLPISILTGKLAADEVNKDLKRDQAKGKE